MEEREIDLVLFDLDGTLLKLNFDSEPMRKDIHNFYLSEYGINEQFKPVLEKIAKCQEALTSQKGEEEAKEATKKALEILEFHEREAIFNSHLLPYSMEAILRFIEHGVRTGILSRTSKRVVLDTLKKYDLGPFDIVIGREDTKETKPSPEPVFLAMKKFRIKPERCLVVGDHPYDIISGKDAGVKTAGVLSGIASKKDLIEAGADYIFMDLKELVSDFFDE